MQNSLTGTLFRLVVGGFGGYASSETVHHVMIYVMELCNWLKVATWRVCGTATFLRLEPPNLASVFSLWLF